MIGRARGTAMILRELHGQLRAPYLPREELIELRDLRVRETVLHAAEHVPFYRDYFADERLDPRELRGADDLAALPLLSKTAVYGQLERFRSDAFPAEELIAVRTSGRSGAWLQVWHDRQSLLKGIAYSERERAVEARLAGPRYRYPVVEIRAAESSVGHLQNVYRRTSFRPLRPRVEVIPIETPTDRILATLAARRPAVLRT